MGLRKLRRAVEIGRRDGVRELYGRTHDYVSRTLFQNILPLRRVDYHSAEYPLIFHTVVKYGIGKLLGDRISFSLSVRHLESLSTERRNLRDVVSTAFDYVGYGDYHTIRPMQSRSELLSLTRIVAEMEPETVLEIGSARGGTCYVWSHAYDSVSTVVSVDLPVGQNPAPTTSPEFIQEFGDGTVTCIRGDAHEEQTLRNVEQAVETVDFLFIDADKSYEGVKRHFEMYSSLLEEGGIIAFHDIEYDEGVTEFWNELEQEYETVRITEPVDRLSGRYTFGIGLVYL